MTGAFMVDSLRGAGATGCGGRTLPDPFRGLQILDRPANGVGVVALHIAVIFRNDAAGEGMASRAVALQHAMAVTEHFDAVVAVKAAAFGVGDAFIGLQGRLLRAGGQFDGVVRETLRRVEQVQIRGVKGQQILRLRRQTGPGRYSGRYPAPPARCGRWRPG